LRLEGGRARAHQPRQALRQLMAAGQLIVAPGAYDGLSARIAEEAGFPAVYLSGGAVARSAGVPDLGLLSLTEVIARTCEVVDSVEVPVIADADTGYGGNLNVARAVREFERSGVAAIHIEDQPIPKRCGHYAHKAVVDVSCMLGRIHAALDARADPDFMVIARTDARAVHGLNEAIDRGNVYAAAGADLIFVEAPESIEEVRAISAGIEAPLVINMFAGGRTPLMPASELEHLGYRLMIVPSDLQRGAISGMRAVARTLREQGSTATAADRMVSFDERETIVRSRYFESLADRYDLPS
jgi:2-methylisocitrate lyase-like PEP mutase family enzyme